MAYSKHRNDFIEARRKWGLQTVASSMLSSSSPDITTENCVRPMVANIKLVDLDELAERSAAGSDGKFLADLFDFLAEMCEGGFLPGIAGGGQTSILLSTYVHGTEDIAKLYSSVERSINEDTQKCVFRIPQRAAVRMFKHELGSGAADAKNGKQAPASSAAAGSSAFRFSGGSDTEENIASFFCGLPESGGMPKVVVGVVGPGNYKRISVTVDSYWQPALDAFCATLRQCAAVLRRDDDDGERNRREMQPIIDALVASLADKYSTSSPSKVPYVVHRSEHNQYLITGHDFLCAGIEYMEAMSRFHRLCLLTRIVEDLRKNTIILKSDTEFSIENPRDLTTKLYKIPSLTAEALELSGDENAIGSDLSMHATIIDPVFCAEAVHSTRRLISFRGKKQVWFFCRRFSTKSVVNGDALVSYGDVGQGFFSLYKHRPTTAAIRSENLRTARSNDARTMYKKRSERVGTVDDLFAADILNPRWPSDAPLGDTEKQKLKLFGITFLPAQSASQQNASVCKVISNQEYLRTMVPYIPAHPIANGDHIEQSVKEHLDFHRVFPSAQQRLGVPSFQAHLTFVEPIVTILSCLPLEKRRIEDILEESVAQEITQIIISQSHIGMLYGLDCAEAVPTNLEKKRVKYGQFRSYYKISLEEARNILSMLRK